MKTQPFFNENRDAYHMAFIETWFDKKFGDRGTSGLIATSRRPERRKVGVVVYMSKSVGARP